MMEENILMTIIRESFEDYIESEQYVKNNLFNIDTFQFHKEVNNKEYGVMNIELHGFIDTENKLKSFIINNIHFVVEDLIIDVSSKFLYFDIRTEIGLISNIHINVIENYKKLKKDKLCIAENFGFYLPYRCYNISSQVRLTENVNVIAPIIGTVDFEYYNTIKSYCDCTFYPYYNISIYLLSNKERLNAILDLLNKNLDFYHLCIDYSFDTNYISLLNNISDYYLKNKINKCDITIVVSELVKRKFYKELKDLDITISKDIFNVFYNLYLCFDEIKIKDKE